MGWYMVCEREYSQMGKNSWNMFLKWYPLEAKTETLIWCARIWCVIYAFAFIYFYILRMRAAKSYDV